MSSQDPNQPPMDLAPTPRQVLCPNCHGGNPPDAKLCMWCDQRLDQVALSQHNQAAQTPSISVGQDATQLQSYQQAQQQQYPTQHPPSQQLNVTVNNVVQSNPATVV